MSDKFIIDKAIENKFKIRIKQNDSTLPMNIVTVSEDQEVVVTHNTPIEYSTLPKVEPKPYVPGVTQEYIPETPFIPEIKGKVEKYNVSVGFLVDKTYELRIGYDTGSSAAPDVVITRTVIDTNGKYYIGSNEVNYLDLLDEFKIAINSNPSLQPIMYAELDSNLLRIVGKTEGVHFRANSPDLGVYEYQTAIEPQAGQAYVPEQEAINIPAVPAVEAKPERYVVSGVGKTQTFSIQYKAEAVSYTSTLTIQSNANRVSKILVAGQEVLPESDGTYNLGKADNYTIVPVNDGTEELTPPGNIVTTVATTYTGLVADTFKMKLIHIESSAIAAEITKVDTPNVGIINIYDSVNGTIEIELYDTLVQSLESDYGSMVDGKYPKPLYRMVLECTTVNNGYFVATVDKVYVK